MSNALSRIEPSNTQLARWRDNLSEALETGEKHLLDDEEEGPDHEEGEEK